MNAYQALNLLASVVVQLKLTRDGHKNLERAVLILKAALDSPKHLEPQRPSLGEGSVQHKPKPQELPT